MTNHNKDRTDFPEIIMSSVREICPSCNRLVDVLEVKMFGNQISKQYACGDSSIDITLLLPNPTLQLRTRNQSGKVLMQSRTQGRVEQRWSWNPGKALQLVRVKGELVHLDCKVCGNQWNLKDDESWSAKFELERDQSNALIVICKKCYMRYISE